MKVSLRAEADYAAAELAAGIAAYALKAPVNEILGERRGSAEVAYARQVAMYLCHVGFEMSLARIAQAFNRDRSTVGHACHRVEDKREEGQFDLWLGNLEIMLHAAPRREIARAAQKEAA